MRKTNQRGLSRKSEINITPFIDILLVLLVIFMTITPQVPVGIKAAIPQLPPPGGKQEALEKTLVLSLDRSGAIRINRDEIEPARLTERLEDIFKTRSDRTMFVMADEELLFNDVAIVIDAAKGAGVDRLGLMTAAIR
jgi:biopolymer transport protein ExbD/biopolymer transport protein TolR